MTQTTPSHSQAVEAAVQRLKALSAPHLYPDLAPLLELLASQQEVAAPGEPTPEMIAAFKAAFKEGSIWEDRITAGLRAALAASRVPVASLASREQGVEAVGAVPVAWMVTGDGTEFEYLVFANFRDADSACADMPEEIVPVPLYTAPPSSKTQDDLAGAGVEGVQDKKYAHYVELNDPETPTYYVRHPGDRYSVADPQPVLASQPKAPAPVPVVQGGGDTLARTEDRPRFV